MVKQNTIMSSLTKFLRKHKKALIVSAAIIVVISTLVGILVATTTPDDGKIAKGVSVNGVDIGGMTVDEAKSAIANSDYYNGSFRLICGDEIVTVNSSDIGLKIDAEQSIAAAYEIARNGGFAKKFGQSFKLLTSGVDIAPSPTLDTEALDMIIYDMGVRLNGEATDAVIEELSATEIRVSPPTSGQGKNVEQYRVAVLNALKENGTGTDIQLQLTQNNSVTLTAEELYSMIKTEPVDAYYTVEGKQLTIIDEVYGRDIDKALISEKLEEFNNGNSIQLSVTPVSPTVTKASLSEDLFSTELAKYSSNFASSSSNRAHNVSRAAASSNGTILLPGDVFSYNDAIGNPNFANGYKMASVYVNGQQSEGVGGGVCQVSSTIYSAVLYANLEIVERRSHSLTVSYVPLGQDATVSYGSVDFKFRNNTDAPIKIEVTTSGGICTVRILGSKPDVEQKVNVINTCVSSTAPTDNITYDDTLPDGVRKVTSKGKNGYVYTSVRQIIENGVVVKTESLTKSSYRMVPNTVIVGTKVAETTEEQPSTPTTPTEEVVTPPSDDTTAPTPDTQETDTSQPTTVTPEPDVIPIPDTDDTQDTTPQSDTAVEPPVQEPDSMPVSPTDTEDVLV